jgi:hypothetical protein
MSYMRRFPVDCNTRARWREIFDGESVEGLFDACAVLSEYLLIIEWFGIGYFTMADGDEATPKMYKEFLEYVSGMLYLDDIREEVGEKWIAWRDENYPATDTEEEKDDWDWDEEEDSGEA